ncbi:MAG: hypothetical protein K2X66_10870, partial [Cyanobacteria bacterium]|nr:hypothetical protein [Cyanobacteriota bacterium]
MLQVDHPKVNGLRPKSDSSSIKDFREIGHHPATVSSVQFGADTNQDLFTPKSTPSPPKQPNNNSGLFTKLNASRFKLPVALLGLAGTLTPFAQQTAVAAVTPESEKLLKALESNDEELMATAFINLGRINERDLVPFLKKTLEKGANEEYTLSAALKATALVISKSPPSEKAAFIKLVKPYLLNVVVLDKDKAIRFMPLDEAKALKKSESETKIRDVRYQAAKTLGILADNGLQNQLLQAAQDSSLPSESRMLSLEALSYSPPSSELGKELLVFFDAEKIADSKSEIMGKLVQILIRHDVKDAWPKVDKLIFPVAPTVTPAKTSSTTPTPASASPMTTNPSNEGNAPVTTNQSGTGSIQNADQSNVMGLESLLGMMTSKTPLGAPNATQKAIIQELLSVKKPQHADTVIKLMTLFPDYFENDAFEKAVDYFQTIASTNHKELVSLLNVKNTEAIARKAMPKPALYLDDSLEKKDEERIKKHAIATRKLMLTFAVATRLQEAKGQFREIFNNPLESQSLRSLAMSGSAEIRDMEAVNDLMTLATDNTESDVLRSDAMGAVMSLTTPPLGPNLKSSTPTGKAMNPQKLAFLKRYLMVYSQNSKFTQSFYQAETYNEIRDARKQLLRDSAPLAAVDELTQQIVAQKLKLYTQSTPMRQKMMASEEFKAFESKMVEYVSKNKKADPLVRIMMLGLLGEAKTKDLKPVLEELVKDPLVRTDIPLLASSNDMLMPGHTRMMMANATRSSAITALGKSGDLDASKTLEKGLWDDSR